MEFTESFRTALESSSSLIYLLAVVGGLLDCLTPCSTLATPTALSYFSTLNPNIPRKRVAVLTAAFALSVSGTYAIMGLIAAAGGKIFAWLGQSPIPYWVVAALLIYFVLINLGLVPMRLTPSFLRKTEIKNFGGKQGTIAGSVAIGAGVALMMGPCAAPILTIILGIIAKKQDVVFGVTLLLAFSVGISAFMVTVSLLGRKGLAMLTKVNKIRGYVGWAIDAIVAVVALYLIYAGAMIAIANSDAHKQKVITNLSKNTEQSEKSSGNTHYLLTEVDAQNKPPKGIEVGAKMADITFKSPEGATTTLSDYHKGKWLFVTFYFKACKACIEEVPLINAMYNDPELKDKLAILAINTADDEATVKICAAENGFAYPDLTDPKEIVADFYKVVTQPFNVLIDPENVVKYADGEFPKNYKKLITGQ